jgi:DNA-binding cell septation regulator SpoVG
MTSTITPVVQDLRLIEKEGSSLRAFATVAVGAFIIHDIRLIKENDKKPWIALPQSEWTGRDGKRHFSPILELPDRIRFAIQDVVIAAWTAKTTDASDEWKSAAGGVR